MKKKKYSEEQIIRILKIQEAGVSIADICRKEGIYSGTFHRWKAKYGGMEVSDARRLKTLCDENSRLKRLVADLTLDNRALQDLITKKF